LSSVAVDDNVSNCPEGEEESISNRQAILKRPRFPSLCDVFQETQDQMMEEGNCEWWPCNNAYTRCDGFWQCFNGIDELNCPNNKCLFNEYLCELRIADTFICLSIEHLFETYVDDCHSNPFRLDRTVYFDNTTNNNLSQYISWNKTKCITADQICRRRHSIASDSADEICLMETNKMYIKDKIDVLINNGTSVCYDIDYNFHSIITTNLFLSTSRLGFFPSIDANYSRDIIPTANRTAPSPPKINISLGWYCNRGILVRFGTNKTKKCLCSPSYFGDRCQWQNQRLSLTLRLLFHSATFSNTVFQVVVMLIDDESGEITPHHEQITFVPTRDCSTKFNIYLLYPDRPKRVSTNYSVRIDVFDKTTLNYHASWHLSVPFSFLPVNRLAARLFMPEKREVERCTLSCGTHGKCRQYINNKSAYFCKCDQEYSGALCNISHTCHCSSDSLCLSSSICVCPLDKFGLRCYLKRSICQSPRNPCENNGLCIPLDDRIALQKFTCLCAEGYFGETCGISQTRIDKNWLNCVRSFYRSIQRKKL
jgi:hypothetical protein